MRSIARKYLSLVAGVALLASFLFPLKASAVVPPLLSYGGTHIFSLPCTCSLSAWAYYAPLFLSSVPVTGPITYVPGASWLFANFIPPIVPDLTDYEGAFLPGVQACWIYVGLACVPLPSLGVTAFTGTGLPGSGAI